MNAGAMQTCVVERRLYFSGLLTEKACHLNFLISDRVNPLESTVKVLLKFIRYCEKLQSRRPLQWLAMQNQMFVDRKRGRCQCYTALP